MHKKFYTAAEEITLRQLFENGASIEEVSAITKRTAGALREWRRSRGVTDTPVRHPKVLKRVWSVAEDTYLTCEDNKGNRDLKQLASDLKRTPYAVKLRLAKLGFSSEFDWASYEDDFLVDEYHRDRQILARKLNRPQVSITARINYLKSIGRIPDGDAENSGNTNLNSSMSRICGCSHQSLGVPTIS